MIDINRMSDQKLRKWSEAWERLEGWDSIATIERVYMRTGERSVPPVEGGAYVCVWPGCQFARNDAAVLWKHVHFSDKHRLPQHSLIFSKWDTE